MRFFKSRIRHEMDDMEIILSYKATSDKQFIGMLFEKYAHLVYGVCYNYLKDNDKCQDAVMFIFEKLFEDLKKYEVKNFSSWIHTIARNHCLAQLKINNKTISLDEKIQSGDFDLNETESEEEWILEHLESLPLAIESLNNDQKICIRMFYLENKSYNDIMEITGSNFKQVKSFVQNGKRNLKIYLMENTKQEGAKKK